jgi:uncharacterized protein (DUF1697 family)
VTTYVALLRAINVGGRTVRMDRLRLVFEQAGCGAVETFIASGNVIFEAPGSGRALARRIERALEEALGFPVAAFLRTPAELARVADEAPFPEDGPGGLYVGFAGDKIPAAAVRRVVALETDVDRFGVAGREIYWRGLAGMGQSKITGAMLEKALGAQATFRSITTVRKLALKYAGASPGRRRPAP